jgi:putative transposase
VLGLTTLFMRPHRIPKLAVMIKPATLFKFHKTFVDRKYRRLFSATGRPRQPGPKGPLRATHRRHCCNKSANPKFGCVRIAQQISHTFGLDIDHDVVRRVLAQHYPPDDSGCHGPSWLTFIAQSTDSRWSIDLFRCESILLYNRSRVHQSPNGSTPEAQSGKPRPVCATLASCSWQQHCRGPFQTPIAA